MIIEKQLPKLAHLAHKPVIKILFVCLGNICRSPAAEGIMQSLVDGRGLSSRFLIDSAGTGNYHVGELPDPRMRAHARRRDYNLTHHCRQVKPGDFDDFDLIIGMDASNCRNLHRMAPTLEAESKIMPMADFFTLATRYDHVPDPYYEGSEGFELVLDLLQDATLNLLDTLHVTPTA
ncbi:MAG: low molecular weight phosphotyrosine protein phosphatase [Paramuribaculum sp.]|nr:low molecular weight phosphotyrosine protein phosphatase [Paramuribaculum sp.]